MARLFFVFIYQSFFLYRVKLFLFEFMTEFSVRSQYTLQFLCCIWLPTCTSCMLILSHGGFDFRDSAAQKANGDYIVRAFGFPSRAKTHLGVCDPEASRFW